MSLHDWIWETFERVQRSGSRDQRAMIERHDEAWDTVSVDPVRAVRLLTEARRRAERAGEAWWRMLCDHWRAQFLLSRLQDYAAAQQVVVAAVAELRKPEYAQLPQRVCLHEDLIYTYLGIDPLGYQREIEAALDYMQGQISPMMECVLCHEEQRASAALALRSPDDAHAAALRYLAASSRTTLSDESRLHHMGSAYRALCRVAYLREDWRGMHGWAVEGEVLAAQRQEVAKRSELLFWQALAALMGGASASGVLQAVASALGSERRAAQRIYQAAINELGKSHDIPDLWSFAARAAFHERAGQLERAIEIWERALEALGGKGALVAELRCHIERCRLLRQAGRPTDQARAEARAVAARLRDPQPALAALDALGV